MEIKPIPILETINLYLKNIDKLTYKEKELILKIIEKSSQVIYKLETIHSQEYLERLKKELQSNAHKPIITNKEI